MRKNIKLFWLFSLFLLLIPQAFAQSPAAVTVAPGETIKVAVVVDLSNLLPAPGLDIAQAAELAIQHINEDGGILGFEVEAVVEDDLCTAEGALLVAENLIDRGDIAAVVGHMCSGASIPASELYEQARIPMVSAASTAGAFTARGLDVTNRTAFNDNLQGEFAAQYMYDEIGVRDIAVIHNSTSYGEGLALTVVDTFEALGGTVLALDALDEDATDYTDVLAPISDRRPELIYFGGYDQEASLLVEQMAALGMEDVIFFAADGVYIQDYLDFGGEFTEGTLVTFGSAGAEDNEALQAFKAEYEAAYGLMPEDLGPYHAEAYDAVGIIAAAIEAVAVVDDAGNLVIERDALIDAIRTTTAYEGVSGTINCNEDGDCSSATIAVYQAVNGEWVPVNNAD